ncbi:hypothetical protein MBLNU230_g1109t1 [Neophaeotheca triangularis]
MFVKYLPLLGILGLTGHGLAQEGYGDSRPSANDQVRVHWLGDTPPVVSGTTFGVPWARGQYMPEEARFSIMSTDGQEVNAQTWPTAYWPDGSIKWTAHAIAASNTTFDEYTINVSSDGGSAHASSDNHGGVTVTQNDDYVEVDTGSIAAKFPKSGHSIISEIMSSSGNVIGENGRLVLQHKSEFAGRDVTHFESNILDVTVQEESGPVRALVTVKGNHTVQGDSGDSHAPWLPFQLRFYMYANSEAIRVVHSVIYDGDQNSDFIAGLGLRFDVPLNDKLYNRHVRIANQEGGFLSEAVLGITGLRRDPGEEIRDAQIEGVPLPPEEEWDERVTSRLQWIFPWKEYSLDQLSPDGFTMDKRVDTQWGRVKIAGGTRAGGLAYLGGATSGGLALGLRDFWQQYPVSLDIRNATDDAGELTLWLYSPKAEPMDLRPYHGVAGQETFEDQLDALDITYEDYQPGWDTPYGNAKTHELYIFGFESTPSTDHLADLTENMHDPPVLVAEPGYMASTEALGDYWYTLPNVTSEATQEIEGNLQFLMDFYMRQVEDHRWYGWWDYGDVMHTYDPDRHQWRYDVGGYAWDNSELSPDLWLWQDFLRTSSHDTYRMAERMTRHTGEVDVYHFGPFKGFGTRHGVQHFSDSSKQPRVSQAQYRKTFFYLSGGDERVGELLDEMLDAEDTFLNVDIRRKVRDSDIEYSPDPEALLFDTGLDWSGVASAWLIEWERRGPRWEESRMKLINTMNGLGNLTNGFATGSALYNQTDGTLSPPPEDPDNEGVVDVSHLTAVFGLPEVIAQLRVHMASEFPQPFLSAWLEYCTLYGASRAEQAGRYGEDFGNLILQQGHSRLTAYAARESQNATLRDRAWQAFYTDGLTPYVPWSAELLDGSRVQRPLEEAQWVSTNEAAQYGLAAIQNLALIGAAPPPPPEPEEEPEEGA